MDGDRESINLGFFITPAEVQEFLDRVETDPEFQALLQSDPVGVLRSYGIVFPPELAPENVSLPSPERISEIKRKMQELVPPDEEETFWFPFFAIGMFLPWFPWVGGGESK